MDIQESVARALSNPFFLGVLSLLCLGIALTGRFSANGSRLVIGLAFVVAAIGLWKYPLPVKIGVLGLIGSSFLLILYYFRPEIIPKDFGILTPAKTLLSKQGTGLIIEIGNSGAEFHASAAHSAPFFSFFGDSNLLVESIRGKLKVSTQIKDTHGDLVAELNRNEWTVAAPPKAFDRNYTDDALEVRNAQGRIVLQVKALLDRIQIQGEWWGPSGAGIRLVQIHQPPGGAMMLPLGTGSDLNKLAIKPMFKYPSEKFFGKLTE